MSLQFLVAATFTVGLVLGKDFRFTGCFLHYDNHSDIQWGRYLHRNLSSRTCSRYCQMEHNITSFFALTRQSICLCDNNVENFEAKGRVQDEQCLSQCMNSSNRTYYCGNNGVLALYTVKPVLKCVNLSQITNGYIKFETTTVTFECESGYVISGNKSLTCQRVNSSWKWSAPQPLCQVILKEKPGNVKGNFIVFGASFLVIIGIVCCALGFLGKRKHVRLCPSPFSSYRRGNLPTVTIQANTVIYSNEPLLQRPPPVQPRQFCNPAERNLQGVFSSSEDSHSTFGHMLDAASFEDAAMEDGEKENREIADEDAGRMSSNYVRPNSHPEDPFISDEYHEYDWTKQPCEMDEDDVHNEKFVKLKASMLPLSNKMNSNHLVPPKYAGVKRGKCSNNTLVSNNGNIEEGSPHHSQVYLDVL